MACSTHGRLKGRSARHHDSGHSDGIFWIAIGCFVPLPIVGWLCNVVAMHFYPLTKEKMAEIQAEIGPHHAEVPQSRLKGNHLPWEF